MSGSTDGILDGLKLLSNRRTASISDENREDLLGSFHRDRRIKFQVLFTTIPDENELGFGEMVEDIDDPLAFSSRRSRQEAVKQ
jgi:hypothetical protein